MAQKNGKTLEEYARSILERETQTVSETTKTANDEKIKAFHKWMESIDPNTPVLTDEQISRESIYEEQILRQF